MISRFYNKFSVAALVLLSAIILVQLISHGEPVPIRQNLSGFPLELGLWRGQETPLDAKVVEILKVDDYLNRVYTHAATGHRPLQFYVGYYGSQRQGATYHSPKNCFPGSGWEIVQSERAQVPLSSQLATVNKVTIQKGLDRFLVLYWYLDRGRIISSEYWAKFYLVWDAMTRNQTHGALLRVSIPLSYGESVDQAFQDGQSFVQEIFPYLGDYLPG